MDDAGVSRRSATIAHRACVTGCSHHAPRGSHRHRHTRSPSRVMALDAVLDAVERLPAFHRVLNTLPTPGQRLAVGNLPGSADAVLVATLARRLATRFFVVAMDGVAE